MANEKIQLSVLGRSVLIDAITIDENYSKKLTLIDLPIGKENWYCTTSNAETAGSGVVIEVSKTRDIVANDYCIIIGVSGGVDKIETFLVSAVVKNTSITATTLVNSYDAGAKIIKKSKKLTLDLKEIEHSWTVKACIKGTSTKIAKQIKDELKALIEAGGQVSMVYGLETFPHVHIRKCMISEHPTDELISGSAETITIYDVTLDFVEAWDI